MRQMLTVLLFVGLASPVFAQAPAAVRERSRLTLTTGTGITRQDGLVAKLNLSLAFSNFVVTADEVLLNPATHDMELRGNVRISSLSAPAPTGNREPSLTIKSGGIDLQQTGIVRMFGGVSYVFSPFDIELTAEEASMNTATHAVELRGDVHLKLGRER